MMFGSGHSGGCRRVTLRVACSIAFALLALQDAHARDKLLLGASSVAAAAGSESLLIPDPLPLVWCLERAGESNPDIARAVAAAEAAGYRVKPAGALDDPRLAYEASNIPTGDFDFRSTPLSGHQFGLHQKLPFPGLLSSREAAAQRDARAAALRLADRELLIASAVESAWAELGFAQQALRITDRNTALLRQLASTAEARYRVGAGLQQDVLRAQVELTALLRQRLRREAAVAGAEATLVALLDLPEASVIPSTEALLMAAPAPALEALFVAAKERSARLGALEQQVEEARARVRVAELEGYPDVDLGLGYRLRRAVAGDPVDGDDYLSAGVTIRLPLNRSKWRARVAERRSLLRRAEADHRAARAAVVASLRRSHAELERAVSEEALLETGLLPQARQSLASSRAGYAVGRIDFLSLLDSQVRLLDAELRLTRARADKRLAFAALESAAGEKLR